MIFIFYPFPLRITDHNVIFDHSTDLSQGKLICDQNSPAKDHTFVTDKGMVVVFELTHNHLTQCSGCDNDTSYLFGKPNDR